MDKVGDPVASGSQVDERHDVGAPYQLTYQPALDGVRGVAVVLVVVFHLDVGVFDGGYLGVSVFFTLSGYLITSLLLAEQAADGRVRLARFWEQPFVMADVSASVVGTGPILATADALIHGSLCETYGFVLAETLASGTPFVVPDWGGARALAGPDGTQAWTIRAYGDRELVRRRAVTSALDHLRRRLLTES